MLLHYSENRNDCPCKDHTAGVRWLCPREVMLSIRQIAYATFLIVSGALPSTAGVIQVSFSGGPAVGIGGSNSLVLDVIGSADVVFDYSETAGSFATCAPIDPSQPYSCSGFLDVFAYLSVQTEDQMSGAYGQFPYQDGVLPDDFCNGVFIGSGTTCPLTLGPGTYEMFVSFQDGWDPGPNATAGLLPVEGVTATLTINSGTVFVVPEPTTQLLALLGGDLLSALIVRSRLYRPLV